MNSRKRIAIAGAFGFYNTGDDGILQSWLHVLRATNPEPDLIVLGGDAPAIKQLYHVEAVDWSNWQSMIEIMPSIDLLLVAGGGLFHDYWAMTPEAFLMPPKTTGPSYYISLVYLAQLFGKPCMLSGVGVGPLTTSTGLDYTRYAFAAAAQATLRDQGSWRCLQQTGISDTLITVTADQMFGLPLSPISLHQWQEWIGDTPEGPIFGVNVRNWDIGVDAQEWINQLAAALDKLLSETGGSAVFIPFQVYPPHPFTNDPSAAREVQQRMGMSSRTYIVRDYLPPDLAEAIIASCDVIIGVRLHSIVMAMRRALPIVALSYDQKVRQAMEEADLARYCLDLTTINAAEIAQAATDALDQRQFIRGLLQTYRETQLLRSQENVRMALDLLHDGAPAQQMDPPLQQWATTIVKDHSRLHSEIAEVRNQSEIETRFYLDQIRELRSEIEKRIVKEAQLTEGADRAQERITELQQSERELMQIKTALRHPVTTGYRVLRRKGGSLARKLIKRNHRSPASPSSGPPETLRQVAGSHGRNRRVCIVAPAFFDMDGDVPYQGGAERYLQELVSTLKELGYDPEIYQPASRDWQRRYDDLNIVGLDTGGSIPAMNEVFHRRVSQPLLTIYLAFFLAAPKCFQPSIGISHGIYWDSGAFHDTPARLQTTMRSILHCVENLQTVVSVDTNTINWIRTMNWKLGEKFQYLPNFVDLAQFRPKPGTFIRPDSRLVVLFPRRLYQPRGFWLMAEVIPEILRRYPEVVFQFVGQVGEDEVREYLQKAMGVYGDGVRWRPLSPEEMHEAYWGADISIIPTVHAEGTSLSCLEAMASGNAVIATDVGGLPNLIIDRFNGLLIRPRADDVLEALDLLIRDAGLRTALGRRAHETAQAFSLSDWKLRWRQLLGAYLPQQSVVDEASPFSVVSEIILSD